ncbi:MAG: DUF2177 family protein [Burkholderiaceae bacterium]
MSDGKRLRASGVVVAFVTGAVVFLALDAVWLTTMADRLYRPALGHLMREDFDVWAAAAFYVIHLGGMTYFAVAGARNTAAAAGRGALYGLVTYAAFDLTNQATMRDWPWHVTLADLSWSPVVTSLSAAAAWRVARSRAH